MDYVSVQIVERVKQIYLWVCLLLFYDNSRHKMYNAALRIPDLFFFIFRFNWILYLVPPSRLWDLCAKCDPAY